MKNQLREKAKIIRKNLNCEICSKKILQIIQQWNVFKTAESVMIYHPINNEINLLGLCPTPKKTFYLPKLVENSIFPAKFTDDCELTCGKYKIKEPAQNSTQNDKSPDLIFVPALCADKNGFRIGYGKGYYDRFLKNMPDSTKIAAVVYEELLFEKIPADNFDKKCDFVITQSGIISC